MAAVWQPPEVLQAEEERTAKRAKLLTFADDVADQVRVYDGRYAKESAAISVISEAQGKAFGRRDGTGVEAVNDVMPTEAAALHDCVRRCLQDPAHPGGRLTVLDFGCGDGRYLAEFVRISRELCPLRVVATDISLGALRTLRLRAAGLGCTRGADAADLSLPWERQTLQWEALEVELSLADGVCPVGDVERELAKVLGGKAHIVVCGWGTLSSMPPQNGVSRQEPFLAAFRRLGRFLVNVVSNRRGNHVVPQRRFEAMRRAFAEPGLPPRAREWLRQRLRMAVIPDTYYYPVGSGATREWLFYSAVSEADERQRLKDVGFQDVEIRICNIINFFDILTKPRSAKLNRAVIALLEKGRLLEAQLLLSRAAAKATSRPLHELRTAPLFDPCGVTDQVARYFISVSS
mmetsp:Transcript_53226/g.158659  ORF Transcript_53226/g.158659 Transcript_53226/m.158659 type:complete len:405 (-) Transcript_53226:52-1266(-)